MNAPDLQRRERVCKMFADKVPVKDIAEVFGVQPPAIWRALRRYGILPPYQRRTDGGRGPRPKRRMDDISGAASNIDDFDLPPRVERDPCPRCGVRADIGCQHHAPFGLTVAA
jgi:hypothetical protein